jgi:FlaA1/EpsC-like NDP-sugar epimerase
MSPWQGDRPSRQLLRILGDAVAALAALTGAFEARIHLPVPFTRGLLPPDRLVFLSREWIAVLFVELAGLYFFGFYDRPRPQGRLDVARRLGGVIGFQVLALVVYYFLGDRAFPRSILLLYALFDALLLFAWRLAVDRLGRHLERRVAIVGSGEAAREIAGALRLHPWHGLRVAIQAHRQASGRAWGRRPTSPRSSRPARSTTSSWPTAATPGRRG